MNTLPWSLVSWEVLLSSFVLSPESMRPTSRSKVRSRRCIIPNSSSGVLALTFADEKDYDRIGSEDRISILGLKDFAPGKPLAAEVKKSDGSKFTIQLNHSFNQAQIEWFKAGSALNLMAKKVKEGKL